MLVYFQVPLGLIFIFAVVNTLLVLCPLITKPRDSAVGFIMVLCTALPYYFIVVKQWLSLQWLEKINSKLNLHIFYNTVTSCRFN